MHAWCQFSDSNPNLWQVILQTSQISYNFESKWPKWPWDQGQWPPGTIPAERIPWGMFDVNLVIPAVMSYHADKVKFTDGHRLRQYPFQRLRLERPRSNMSMFGMYITPQYVQERHWMPFLEILSQSGQMTLKAWRSSQWPQFSIPAEISKMHFGANLVTRSQTHYKL